MNWDLFPSISDAKVFISLRVYHVLREVVLECAQRLPFHVNRGLTTPCGREVWARDNRKEGDRESQKYCCMSGRSVHRTLFGSRLVQFHQNVLTWAESLGPTRDPHMTMLATTS